MPQIPPPYQPPYVPPNVTPYYGAPIDPLRPAKRASLAMLIIGPLMLICGICASLMPVIVKAMPAEQTRQMFDQMQASSRIPPDQLLSALMISGILVVIIGIAFAVLGVVIRRGGRVSAILGSVLTGLVLLNLIVNMLGALAGFGGGGPLGFLMQLVMAGVFGLQMYFLIQAVRASGTIKQARQQYQAQYWQYQQNMQAYMQYGQQMQPPVMGYRPGYAPVPGYAPGQMLGQMPPQMPPAMPPPGYPTLQGYAQAPVPPVQPPAPPAPPADPNVPPGA